MLTKLTLIDFQKHAKFVLELDPLVTTLIGPSDKGKTSILRGLKWLTLNQPDGDGFIRRGSKSCRILVHIDDHKIVRERGGSSGNIYRLDGEEYKSFGKGGVPEDISNILNLSDLNFQDQLAPHFWFSETAGKVSRELNAVVNLGVIDDTLAGVAQELRKATSQQEVCESRLAEAERSCESLQWVKDFDTDLQRLESLQNAATEKKRQTSQLGDLIASYAKFDALLTKWKGVAEAGTKLKQVGDKLVALHAKKESLRTLLESLRNAREVAQRQIPDIAPLTRLKAKLDAVTSKRDALEKLLEEYQELCRQKKRADDAIALARAAWEKETKGLCPTCRQPVTLS